ncbi:MAG: dTDP-4-keto-6-deoxy-D-glucose epimerase [Planctomycetes bacterium]|nr:dTDP-4-keto-6-deoxy-D-glucose epimerase [Planctomycetota bacterium]
MKFTETSLPGVYVVDIEPHVDDRGYFARVWCEQEFRDHGLNPQVVQINTIVSHVKGTLRGIHSQKAPHAEAKFVRCLRGSVYDVAVDLRPDSPTFQQWHAIELRAGDGRMFYLPEGCGHGIQTLEDQTEVSYQATAAFASSAAIGFRHDDPAFGIRWPLPVECLSEADRNWPMFNPVQSFSSSETEAKR